MHSFIKIGLKFGYAPLICPIISQLSVCIIRRKLYISRNADFIAKKPTYKIQERFAFLTL